MENCLWPNFCGNNHNGGWLGHLSTDRGIQYGDASDPLPETPDKFGGRLYGDEPRSDGDLTIWNQRQRQNSTIFAGSALELVDINQDGSQIFWSRMAHYQYAKMGQARLSLYSVRLQTKDFSRFWMMNTASIISNFIAMGNGSWYKVHRIFIYCKVVLSDGRQNVSAPSQKRPTVRFVIPTKTVMC